MPHFAHRPRVESGVAENDVEILGMLELAARSEDHVGVRVEAVEQRKSRFETVLVFGGHRVERRSRAHRLVLKYLGHLSTIRVFAHGGILG